MNVGPSKALPRCALPKYLTEELQKHIPNAIFSSNPCRSDFNLSNSLRPHTCLLLNCKIYCLLSELQSAFHLLVKFSCKKDIIGIINCMVIKLIDILQVKAVSQVERTIIMKPFYILLWKLFNTNFLFITAKICLELH